MRPSGMGAPAGGMGSGMGSGMMGGGMGGMMGGNMQGMDHDGCHCCQGQDDPNT